MTDAVYLLPNTYPVNDASTVNVLWRDIKKNMSEPLAISHVQCYVQSGLKTDSFRSSNYFFSRIFLFQLCEIC